MEHGDGRSEQVTDIPSGIEALAESLEAVTKLPVKRYDYRAYPNCFRDAVAGARVASSAYSAFGAKL